MKAYQRMTDREKAEFASEMGKRAWSGLSEEERSARISRTVDNLHSPAGRLKGLRTRARSLECAVIPKATYDRLVQNGVLDADDMRIMDAG